MKRFIYFFVLVVTFTFGHSVLAETIHWHKNNVKKAMLSQGLELIEESSGDINRDAILTTSLRHYSPGKYVFLGLVNDCHSRCTPTIKVGQPGDLPASLPNADATLKRVDGKVWIKYGVDLVDGGEYYFMLFNDYTIDRFAFIMLFKMD